MHKSNKEERKTNKPCFSLSVQRDLSQSPPGINSLKKITADHPFRNKFGIIKASLARTRTFKSISILE
jgi:hypothetical protein